MSRQNSLPAVLGIGASQFRFEPNYSEWHPIAIGLPSNCFCNIVIVWEPPSRPAKLADEECRWEEIDEREASFDKPPPSGDGHCCRYSRGCSTWFHDKGAVCAQD